MPPKDEEHGCLTVPLDIISNLPENVLDGILMRVPLRDAVRTSILSRKWRFKWCRLPQLELDGTFWEATSKGCLESPSVQFTNIMYHLLTLHEGPVMKFTLETYKQIPNINNMIYFLSRNGIQHLVLRLSVISCALPSSFFACSQLRHLTLEGCSIPCLPPDFNGFAMLISMELKTVWISSENLGNLISQCPLLEQLLLHKILCDSLEIDTFGSLDDIQINAPMLRSFDFSGCMSSICFINVPLLVNVSLKDVNARGCDIAKFLESLSALKHLQLDNMFWCLGIGGVPTVLPFVLHCVKHLCLSGFHWSLAAVFRMDPFDVVLSVLCLMRSFPYLQYVELKFFLVVDFCDGVPAPISPEVLEPLSDMTFDCLREVKLDVGFIGTMPAMLLINFLLTKSPVLVRMLINLRSLTEESARGKILDGLSKIKPASPEAKVDFIF